ncbi:MAG TPA: calcium-binding protein [Phenylobacterium sp.]|nr:calcium-binding protein [Phenylobacterium sp.]
MTTVVSGNFSLNFDELDLSSLVAGDITVATALQITTSGGGINDNFFGSFQYSATGDLTGGTLNRLQETFQGQLVFDITNTSVPVTTFLQWVVTNDNASARAYILAGPDSISGSSLGDVLRGLGGPDSIAGGSGNDTLDGGTGDDIINGNLGDDVILGGAGINYLRGDDGNDQITGGIGFDDINGNMGNDTGLGGEGGDWVVGGKDNDSLLGETGDDIVYGNLGADTCIGGDGDDWVRGGQDNDTLSGGNGNDWMSGDRGSDTISGGAGADIFHTFADAGIDRVIDFSAAEGDRVLLDPGTAYTVSQVAGDTVVDMGGGAQLILVGVQMSALPQGWIYGA